MKPGLSFERHTEIAERLKAISAELNLLAVELGHAYPKNSDCARVLKNFMSLGGAFNLLRLDLDRRLACEHPDKFDPEIYYGKAREKEKADGQILLTEKT